MIRILEDESQSKNSSTSFWNDNIAIQRMYSAITYLNIKDNQWQGKGSAVLVNMDPVVFRMSPSGKKKITIQAKTGEKKDFSVTSNMLADSKGIASLINKMNSSISSNGKDPDNDQDNNYKSK